MKNESNRLLQDEEDRLADLIKRVGPHFMRYVENNKQDGA